MIHYDAMKPLNTSGGGGGGPQCIYDGFRHQNLKMWDTDWTQWTVERLAIKKKIAPRGLAGLEAATT